MGANRVGGKIKPQRAEPLLPEVSPTTSSRPSINGSSSSRKKKTRSLDAAGCFDGEKVKPNKIVLHPITISDMGNSEEYDSFLQGHELNQEVPYVVGDEDEQAAASDDVLGSTAEFNDYYGGEEFERPNTSHSSRPASRS
jgi:hypothetical protein